jgi:hypothetical protein
MGITGGRGGRVPDHGDITGRKKAELQAAADRRKAVEDRAAARAEAEYQAEEQRLLASTDAADVIDYTNDENATYQGSGQAAGAGR